MVHDGAKSYCEFLFSRNYKILSYANKELIFITPFNCPALRDCTSGELVCGVGSQAGIEIARERGFDYVFFLDYDCLPDPHIIERLLALNVPLAGGMLCARGNENKVIGHNYIDRENLVRRDLTPEELTEPCFVDGISGGLLLIARSIFEKVDLSGYTNPAAIPGSWICDDEFLQLAIYDRLGIKPMVDPEAKACHYCEDGYYYRTWGIKHKWKA